GSGKMQVIGDGFDVHLALGREMQDRDQHRVFDAGEPDSPGVPATDAFMQSEEAEQVVHQLAKLGSLPLTNSSGREIVSGTAGAAREAFRAAVCAEVTSE